MPITTKTIAAPQPQTVLPKLALAATAAIFAAAAFIAAPQALAQEPAAETPVAAVVGDPDKGKRVFNRCKSCHTVEEGAPKRVGPNLYGIVGAEFGRHEDFNYSANLMELKAEGKVWDEATIDAYLKKPKDVIPKGTMSFAGLPKEKDRANVIAYLATFGGPDAAADAPAE